MMLVVPLVRVVVVCLFIGRSRSPGGLSIIALMMSRVSPGFISRQYFVFSITRGPCLRVTVISIRSGFLGRAIVVFVV
jgi:hypothetical protein